MSSDHHRANIDSNSSSDDRGDGVECSRQACAPVAGEGWMPGMPGFSSTSTTPSATPVGSLSDGVAPNPCPKPGTPFTLPGNKRVAVGAADARWGEGNTWQPHHFSVVADAIGSGLGSTHGNTLRDSRNLNHNHRCCCRLHLVRVARYRSPPATHRRFMRRAVWQADAHELRRAWGRWPRMVIKGGDFVPRVHKSWRTVLKDFYLCSKKTKIAH